MILRPLTEQDLSQLLLIENAAQLKPWSHAAFQRCSEANYPGWVLEQDDKIIGFALISLVTGECHILNICIHPDYQHQGFGHYLLRHVLNTAKNLGSIMAYLEVRRSNTKAINLYEKIGFAQIGDRKNYYPAAKGREDALVFAKDLRIDDEDDKS